MARLYSICIENYLYSLFILLHYTVLHDNVGNDKMHHDIYDAVSFNDRESY